MAKLQRINPLTIAQQKAGLIFTYHDRITYISRRLDAVDCQIRLQPSEHSREYVVRVFYQIYDSPKVWLVDPDLELYEGNKPHHIYGDKDEKGHARLCVYDPAQDKWNSQKSLAHVFVPWIITWLYAYEIWLICGKWTYPETTASDNADKPGKQQ